MRRVEQGDERSGQQRRTCCVGARVRRVVGATAANWGVIGWNVVTCLRKEAGREPHFFLFYIHVSTQ